VIDTGQLVSTNLFHDITNLRTGKTFDIVVYVWNASNAQGYSSPTTFSVLLVPPDTIASFTAAQTALQATTNGDAIRLEWEPTSAAPTGFKRYEIERIDLSLPEIERIPLLLRRLPNAAQRAFIDPHVIPGHMYEYHLYLVVQEGLDELMSEAAVANASIVLDHVVLTSVLEPETYGVELRHRAGSAAYLQSNLTQDKRKVIPVGSTKGRSVAGVFSSWDDTMSFEIISDSFLTAEERLRRFQALVDRLGTICFRDFTGLRRFATIDSVQIARFSTTHHTVTVKISEETFVEGERV
jgi:hypothetical protein